MPKAQRVVTIGRGTKNEVIISDDKASRVHCQIIKYDNGTYGISDFGSTNGTFVNGFKVTGEHILNPYDVVRIGHTTLPWQSYFDGKGIPNQRQEHNATRVQGGGGYGGTDVMGGAYGSSYGSSYSSSSYSDISSGEDRTAAAFTLATGILSLLMAMLIIILFFTSSGYKLAHAIIGSEAIKLFPAYLNGGSFTDGKWILIIIGFLSGTASDMIAAFDNSKREGMANAGLVMGNIGATLCLIFLILAIFAKQITEGMVQSYFG